MSDGAHTANIVLLGQYDPTGFNQKADATDGTVISALHPLSIGKVNFRLRDFDTFRQFITGVGIHAVFDLHWAPQRGRRSLTSYRTRTR